MKPTSQDLLNTIDTGLIRNIANFLSDKIENNEED